VAGAGRFLLQPRIPGRHSAATIHFEWIPYKTSCGRINITGQLWCRLWCELGVEAGAERFLLEPQILGIHSRSAIQFTFPFCEITGPTIKVTRKQHSRKWCKLCGGWSREVPAPATNMWYSFLINNAIRTHPLCHCGWWNYYNKTTTGQRVVRAVCCGWSREVPAPATGTIHPA